MTTTESSFAHNICPADKQVCLSQNMIIDAQLMYKYAKSLINRIKVLIALDRFNYIISYFTAMRTMHVTLLTQYEEDLIKALDVSDPMAQQIEEKIVIENNLIAESEANIAKTNEYLFYVSSPNTILRIIATQTYVELSDYDKYINDIEEFVAEYGNAPLPFTSITNVDPFIQLQTYNFLVAMYIKMMDLEIPNGTTPNDFIASRAFSYKNSSGAVITTSIPTPTVLQSINAVIMSYSALNIFYMYNLNMLFNNFPAPWNSIPNGSNPSYTILYDDYGLIKYIVETELNGATSTRPTCYDNPDGATPEPYFYFLRWLYILGNPPIYPGISDLKIVEATDNIILALTADP